MGRSGETQKSWPATNATFFLKKLFLSKHFHTKSKLFNIRTSYKSINDERKAETRSVRKEGAEKSPAQSKTTLTLDSHRPGVDRQVRKVLMPQIEYAWIIFERP